jgi:hypothetical protein
MRWFKHLTDSWHDEKIAAIVAEHGLEIYGFWWRLLEIVAKQMDKSCRTNCNYSVKVWGKFAGISPKKFQKFCQILEENKLIISKNGHKSLEINIPNLLKFRDEYTRKEHNKSGECQE